MMIARAYLAPLLLSQGYAYEQFLLVWLSIGCASIVGHIFPIFIGFRGGKGVATSFGVALGLWPYFTICAVIAFIAWVIFLFKWHYISLASILASITVPFSLILFTYLFHSWQFLSLWPLFLIAFGIPILVILRHRSNISRLQNGTESKVALLKKP